MVYEDFYTGEPVDSGSPPSFQERKNEYEAAQMATFGTYDYDPGARMMNMQPYQSPYTPYANMPSYGLGSPYRYTPNGNLAPTYGVYQPGYNTQFFNQYNNPYYNNPYQQYRQPQVPTSYTIPGINMSGEYLYPLDVEQRIDNIQKDYFMKMQQDQAIRDVDNKTSVYGYSGNYGYNYYGVPYYNPWQYNSVSTELSREVDQLQAEARENRLNFNLKISKLAHNIVGGNADEELLRERYVGKTVPIPQHYIPTTDFEEMRRQNSLKNAEPFDNSAFYRQQFAQVSEEFHKYISPDSNLKEVSDNMNLVWADWEMEEEQHRRKNLTTMYDSSNNAYKYYIQRKAQERYCQEKGIAMPGFTNLGNPTYNTTTTNPKLALQQNILDQFSTLSSSVKLADDGTLNVVCNVGSNKGQVYSVVSGVNQNEDEYRAKKERFDRFLGSITSSIYQSKAYD